MKNIRLRHQNKKIKRFNVEEMKRKISLREDIDYSRGYLKALNENCDKTLKRKLKNNSYKDCSYVMGYYKGYYNRKSYTNSSSDEEEEYNKASDIMSECNEI